MCQCKDRYTVIYTNWTRYGSIVHHLHVTLNKEQSLYDVLMSAQIEPSQVAFVFYGHVCDVQGNYSEIKGL